MSGFGKASPVRRGYFGEKTMDSNRHRHAVHHYTAAFRLYGKHLDIDAMTTELRISPTEVHRIGELRRKNEVWKENMWSVSSKLKETSSLEKHLSYLLNRLEPLHRAIMKNKGSLTTGVFLCGHFTNAYYGFCGGPTLSAGLLKRIGKFGFPLFLDTYANTDI